MTKRTIEQAKKYADGLIRERDLVRKELVKCNSELILIDDAWNCVAQLIIAFS